MVRLDRYIGTSVFFGILAVLGVIVSLAALFAFIDELGDVAVAVVDPKTADVFGTCARLGRCGARRNSEPRERQRGDR